MSESLRARLHRRIGGAVCRLRARHRLILVEHHWSESSGESHLVTSHGIELRLTPMTSHSARRPLWPTCWQLPGD